MGDQKIPVTVSMRTSVRDKIREMAAAEVTYGSGNFSNMVEGLIVAGMEATRQTASPAIEPLRPGTAA